jgi:lipopolysaccharide biosynthesis regulator YciM
MKKGDHEKALEIVRSIGRTDKIEVDLRTAGALGHLGKAKEAMNLLMGMKERIITSGRLDGLERVYMHMADISSANGDDESSVNYLTKALGVSDDISRKRIYGMLASSYNAIGMTAKAEECLTKSK